MIDDGFDGPAGDDGDDEFKKGPIPEPWIPPDVYQTGPLPDVPAEILECFPSVGMVHEYVWWAYQTTFASPIYHVAAILPTLAWDMAQRGWSCGPRGKQIALQSFLIGDSSSGKSTCLRRAKDFHEAVLERSYPGWQVLGPEADSRSQEIAQQNTARLNPWILANGTAPGLIEELFDRWNPLTGTTPVILWLEEVSQLLERKREHAIASILLELFDKVPKVERQLARYREMKRKGQAPPSIVRMPAVSGVFAGTPVSLTDKLDNSSFEGGLVSRSLWVTGKPDPQRWFLVDQDRSEARQIVIDRWIHYGHHHHGLEVGGCPGKIVALPVEVKRICLEELFPAYRRALAGDGDQRLRAVRGRGLEHAETIAGLYAWSRGATAVSEADMRAAVAFVRWSMRTVSQLAVDAGDDGWRDAQKALEYIRESGKAGMRKSALYRRMQCSKQNLEQALALLIDQDVIVERRHRQTDSAGKPGPGRPSMVYRLTKLGDDEPKVIDIRNYAKQQEKDLDE